MRSVSRADQALIERTGATPPQLERWRHAGVFPRADREYGKTRGGRSAYPPWAADQAMELLRLTGRGKAALADVALVMFVRDRWVREDKLKDAYRYMLRRAVGRGTKGADPWITATEALADSLNVDLKRAGARARWKARVGSSDQSLYNALDCMAQILTHAKPDAGLAEMLDAAGTTQLAESFGQDRDQTVEAMKKLFQRIDLSLVGLCRLVEEISIEELKSARDFTLEQVVPLQAEKLPEQDIALVALGIAAILRATARDNDSLTVTDKSPRRPLQRPRGTAHGKEPSACDPKIPRHTRAALSRPTATG
jgi:hypothetical protein